MNAKDALMIAQYKAGTIALRVKLQAEKLPRSPLEIPCINGVITVPLHPAQSLRGVISPSEVFGKSEIDIPEYRLREK